MTSTSNLRALVELAVPLALVQAGQMVMGAVDTAMVGRIGAADLAAVALGNSLFFTASVIGMGLVQGTEPMVAQAWGAGDGAEARLSMRRGVVLALIATPLVAALVLLGMWTLPAMGVDPDCIAPTRDYLLARMPGIPAFLVFMAQRSYLQGLSRTRPALVATVVGIVVNVPLDYLAIFGDGGLEKLGLPGLGLPALGALGAGIATSAASWSRLAVGTIAVAQLAPEGPRPPLATRLMDAARDTRALLAVVRIGAPIGFQFLMEVGLFSLVSVLMARLSAKDAASHQVALTLASISFSFMIGLGGAASAVVGQRVGAGDQPGARRAGFEAIGMAVAFMSVPMMVFLFAPGPLAELMTDDPTVLSQAIGLVMIAGVFQIVDGVQVVGTGALRGAGDTLVPAVLHGAAMWLVGLPVGLYLGFVQGMGAAGLWWGLTLGLGAASAVVSGRFWVQSRRFARLA